MYNRLYKYFSYYNLCKTVGENIDVFSTFRRLRSEARNTNRRLTL